MSDATKIVPFIRKREGGLSFDTNDDASKNPCPYPYFGKFGANTSNGWTWKEWISIKGVTPDSATAWYQLSIPSYFDSTNEVWGELFKQYYWDKVQGDKINFQPLANMLGDMAFNSDPSVANKHIQIILGITADGVSGLHTISAINNYPDQNDLYQKLIDNRDKFYEHLTVIYPKDKEFLNGWEKRVQDLIEFSKQ